jgi:hypothetical protein
VPFVQIFFDGRAQEVCADVEARVGVNLAQVVAAEAEDVRALDERVVALLGGVDDEVAVGPCVADAAVAGALGGAVAGALEANEVGLGAAARERAETLARVADEFAEPAQDARLDDARRGRVAPRRAVLIQSRGERVGPDGDGQRRRVEEPVVARARDVHRVRDDVALELSEDFLDVLAFGGQRLVEEAFEFGGRGGGADGGRVERARVVGDEADGGRAEAFVFVAEVGGRQAVAVLRVGHPLCSRRTVVDDG